MTRLREIANALTFQVLAIAVVTRLGLIFVNWFSLRVLPRLPFYETQRPDWFLPLMPALDGWAR